MVGGEGGAGGAEQAGKRGVITPNKNVRNNRTPFPDQFLVPIGSSGSSSLQPKVETPMPVATPIPTPKPAAAGTSRFGVDAAAGVGLDFSPTPTTPATPIC